MTVKLIAIDLDDTLAGRQASKYTVPCLQSIQAAQKKGFSCYAGYGKNVQLCPPLLLWI